jgi:hypothetical protein
MHRPILLALLALTAHAGAETRFTVVDSSPTSWVARGYHNYTVSPAVNWNFQVTSGGANHTIGFNITGTPLPGTDVDNWFLTFAAAGNVLITPGVYANFQRWPFNDATQPGLEFGSTGRLDNMASGTFEVQEATYNGSGQLLTFAANFTHYGETNVNNYAICELRYNSVPAPGLGAVALGAMAPVATRRRRWADQTVRHEEQLFRFRSMILAGPPGLSGSRSDA